MDSIGRYKIECELGRGAMGIALRAVDSAIGRTVVIKTIRLGELTDPVERKRLRDRLFHEARSAGMVSHPGIVTIYDVAEEGELAYIAMEFVNGPTLDQLLSREQPLEPATLGRTLGLDPDAVRERMEYARRWLAGYAPEDLKFELRDSLPDEVRELSSPQREALGRLARELYDDMDGDAVHAVIHRVAKEVAGVTPAQMFQAVYVSLLGKPRGPRAGWFVTVLGTAFCARRFREAAGELR